MQFRPGATVAAFLAACLLAGCAGSSGDGMPTASIPAAPKVDPVCSQLASQIEALRGEGVATKVENAAAKKYKMKPADLSKAAQLNKANEDYQARCGTVPVRSAIPSPVVPRVQSVAGAKSASAALPSAQPAAAGLVAQADAPATKQLSPESIARAADAAAARAAVKAAQAGNVSTAGN